MILDRPTHYPMILVNWEYKRQYCISIFISRPTSPMSLTIAKRYIGAYTDLHKKNPDIRIWREKYPKIRIWKSGRILQTLPESVHCNVKSIMSSISMPSWGRLACLNGASWRSLKLQWCLESSVRAIHFKWINQSRCRSRITSVGEPINESLICRPACLRQPD